MEEEYRITSTSPDTAEGEPIPLWESEAEERRLVFLPMKIDNQNNDAHSVKGHFVYERKDPNGDWESLDDRHLNSLSYGEGFKLPLHSEGLYELFKHLEALYSIDGVPMGAKTYIPHDVAERLNPNSIDQVVEWLAAREKSESVAESLTDLDRTDLQRINAAAGLSTLKKAHRTWSENLENSDEEFWQDKLEEYPFVLSQLFPVPTVIFESEAYVGGKRIDNSEGNLADFLIENEITRDAVLIEIKTPATDLLGSEYRSGTYNVSRDLAGATQQVLTQRQTLNEEYRHLGGNPPDVFDSRCVVVAGNTDELDNDAKRRSFELYRSSQSRADVVTYDELFRKTRTLIDLLEGES